MTMMVPTTETHKVCSKCSEVLPKSEFYHDKNAKDGLVFSCKTCFFKRFKYSTPRTHKGCTWCKEIKPLSEFHRMRRNKKTQVRACCKTCFNNYNKSLRKFYQRFKDTPETKTCNKCHITKPATQFHVNSSNNDRLHRTCKDCLNPMKREYEKRRPQKTCRLCNTTKPRVKFPQNENSKDAYARLHICKRCFEEHEVEEGDVDAIIDKVAHKKVCSKCNVRKDVSEYYYRNRTRKDGSVIREPEQPCKPCKHAIKKQLQTQR